MSDRYPISKRQVVYEKAQREKRARGRIPCPGCGGMFAELRGLGIHLIMFGACSQTLLNVRRFP